MKCDRPQSFAWAQDKSNEESSILATAVKRQKDFSPALETRISPGVYPELAEQVKITDFSLRGRWV